MCKYDGWFFQFLFVVGICTLTIGSAFLVVITWEFFQSINKIKERVTTLFNYDEINSRTATAISKDVDHVRGQLAALELVVNKLVKKNKK